MGRAQCPAAPQSLKCSPCLSIQVNSVTLRPVLIATIKEKGFGKLLKEAGGPFDCSESWIRKLCHKLK